MAIYMSMMATMLLIWAINTHAKLHIKYTLGAFAVLLVATAGLRYQVGTDYPVYMINYEQYKLESLLEFQRVGLRIIARIATLIRDDYATWFFLMSFFTIGFAIKAIRKHSVNPAMSVVLFVFLGCWHGSFNLVKQYGAVAILLMGHGALLERKFMKWCIVCILAATFHVSAIIMIPIYFLVTRTIDIKQIALLGIMGIVISIAYEQLFDVMAFLKEEESVTTITSRVGSRSVNLLRVGVACAPALLLLVYRKCYNFENSSAQVWANFSLLNAVLYVAARNSVYLTRFCVYTDVFNVFFIPALITCIPEKRNRNIVISVCMILYCCFWLYDLSKGSTTSVFHWIFER